jgi:hypothetical protein
MAKKKNANQPKEQLFEERFVPAATGTGKLFDVEYEARDNQPVECLGIKFPNDKARRQYFLDELRAKLKDPEFRKIEGFPIGADEDILALSDPPYYTACPNPFLGDFVRLQGTVYDSRTDNYRREPYAADVSEGKSDVLYTAHSYPTKVPHQAIMRYILHYTAPEQVILDGFCGSGMTGVAAQLCAHADAVRALGYTVSPDGSVETKAGEPFSVVGSRFCIQVDLSPLATFLTHNHNTVAEPEEYRSIVTKVIADAENECGWMYQTGKGNEIYHTVWSEILLCNECGTEISFWDAAVDKTTDSITDQFSCPKCKSLWSKRELKRATEAVLHPTLKKVIQQAKYVPVGIRELKRGNKAERPLDLDDKRLIEQIEKEANPHWYPTDSIERDIDMWYERDYRSLGLFTLDGFYTKRNLRAFSTLWEFAYQLPHGRIRNAVLFTMSGMCVNLSKMNRWRPNVSFPYNPISGTLYVPALPVESNVFHGVKNKVSRLTKVWSNFLLPGRTAISTQSSAKLTLIDNNSVDYIFTDPPFGSNIIYSDLSLLHEGWLQIATNTKDEAVVHRRKKTGKKLDDYRRAMTCCFKEFQRVLKPGRWITVEFHNSKNAVWNAIQEALQEAGFVVADVRVLDKQQGSFKQVTAQGAVKQDLIISAYKPTDSLDINFTVKAGSEDAAWAFVRTHLHQLPVFVRKGNGVEVLAERQDYLLYDRMVAFHVQRSVVPPLSASEFYAGLRQRFPERDSMFFLSEQVNDYDRKRLEVIELEQYDLFVSDEKSAIQWVRRVLAERPTKYQDLQPLYMKEAQRVWEKHEQPLELMTILEQSFVEDKDGIWRTPDPKNEMHLEQLRHRALMKEFQQYLDSKGKLKVVRTEALRAGFKDAWQKKDYATIVQIAKRIPDAVVQEDPALLMYFDNASLLLGE